MRYDPDRSSTKGSPFLYLYLETWMGWQDLLLAKSKRPLEVGNCSGKYHNRGKRLCFSRGRDLALQGIERRLAMQESARSHRTQIYK